MLCHDGMEIRLSENNRDICTSNLKDRKDEVFGSDLTKLHGKFLLFNISVGINNHVGTVK